MSKITNEAFRCYTKFIHEKYPDEYFVLELAGTKNDYISSRASVSEDLESSLGFGDVNEVVAYLALGIISDILNHCVKKGFKVTKKIVIEMLHKQKECASQELFEKLEAYFSNLSEDEF